MTTYEFPDILKLWDGIDGSHVFVTLEEGDKACDPGPGGAYVEGPAVVAYELHATGYKMAVKRR